VQALAAAEAVARGAAARGAQDDPRGGPPEAEHPAEPAVRAQL